MPVLDINQTIFDVFSDGHSEWNANEISIFKFYSRPFIAVIEEDINQRTMEALADRGNVASFPDGDRFDITGATFPASIGQEPTTWDLRLFDYGADIVITPPDLPE